jgi:hypothetical protein
LLLTYTELDFLLGKKEFTKPQKRYLRSRLNKRIKEFASTELKLLQDNGYLLAVAANSSGRLQQAAVVQVNKGIKPT